MSDTTDPIAHFDRFTAAVRARLEQGRDAYGDESFDASPDALLTELQEELQDVCAWSYILHCRLERMRKRLRTRGGGG